MNLQSGIFDRARLVSNVLMLVLVAGNIFFSIQYAEGVRQQASSQEDQASQRLQLARFLKFFVDTVLNASGTISADQRIKLESDVRQIGDADVLRLWNSFVDSADAASAQERAVALMSLIANKLI
jgi:hypothetical protein